jgi:hypothetical protein
MAQCPFQKVSFIENAHVLSLFMAILLIFPTFKSKICPQGILSPIFAGVIKRLGTAGLM